MNRKAVMIAALIALLPIILAGCGGGGGTGSPGSSIATPKETGSIKINIQWPVSTSRTIPPDTDSIVVTVAGKGMTAQPHQVTFPETQLTIDDVPVGARTLKAAAIDFQYQYPYYVGTQVVVAAGKVDVTVVKNQTVAAAIELQPLTAAQQALEDGRTELNNLMFNGMTSAQPETYFNQVPNGDDCYPEARFGLALTGLWRAMRQLDPQPGGGGPTTPPTPNSARAGGAMVPLTGGLSWSALDITKLTQSIKGDTNPFSAMLPTEGFAYAGPATRSENPKTFQDDIKNILIPALEVALAEMAVAESDAGFAFFLGSGWYYQMGGTYVQYMVHQGDVYLFDGLLRAMKSEAHLICAYNLDSGTFDFDRNAQAMDTNADGILVPSEYLPASPFLTLADAISMTSAKQELLEACSKAIQGLNLMVGEGETDDGFSVIDWNYITQGDMRALRSIVFQVQQSMAAPVTLPVPNDAGTANIQVYLGAWFTTPPADLKAFLPNTRVNTDGSTSVIGSTFPDRTFGGLFPGGLPDYLVLRNW